MEAGPASARDIDFLERRAANRVRHTMRKGGRSKRLMEESLPNTRDRTMADRQTAGRTRVIRKIRRRRDLIVQVSLSNALEIAAAERQTAHRILVTTLHPPTRGPFSTWRPVDAGPETFDLRRIYPLSATL